MPKLLLLVLSGFWLSGAAQQSPQSLLSAGGGHSKTNSYLIDWSLGETVIETATSPANVYTQGFLQPMIFRRKQHETRVAASSLKATALPNPARNQVTVSFSALTSEPLTLSLHNAVGVGLSQQPVAQGSSQVLVNTSSLMPGSYLISMRNHSGLLIESFYIIKMH